MNINYSIVMNEGFLDERVQESLRKMEERQPSFRPHESGFNEFSFAEFYRICEMYHIQYSFIPNHDRPHWTPRCKIQYKQWIIIIHPGSNEAGITLAHEAVHHWYDRRLGFDASEEDVEQIAREFYEKNKEKVDRYTEYRIQSKKPYSPMLESV
jgi:hypothetical protein